jgi:hypothetical protein
MFRSVLTFLEDYAKLNVNGGFDVLDILNRVQEVVDRSNFGSARTEIAYDLQEVDDELILFVGSNSGDFTTIISPGSQLVLDSLEEELNLCNSDDDYKPIEAVENVLRKFGKVYTTCLW